jgi:hypothetical protein
LDDERITLKQPWGVHTSFAASQVIEEEKIAMMIWWWVEELPQFM